MKPMRICKFTLPEHTPSGLFGGDIHEDLVDALLTQFENVTTTLSETYLVVDSLQHDDSITYEVVMEDTAMNTNTIKRIVLKFAKLLEQSHVRIQLPNGETYFLEV